ncbi:MAG TPA: HdeD family acid-resistance protein [Solirubrobacteraceae bacterium]|jgi:uncharacterized membrane protein HdeD (DUF308 family)|nr:HdeD family acid-resistance protein [Solirubrobacteraceae bacterium]
MAHEFKEQFAAGDMFGDRSLEAWMAQAPLTREQIHRARVWLMVVGVLAPLTGLVAIAVPIAASVTIAIFIGWVMLAGGIAVGVDAFSHRSPLRAFEAVLTFLAGLYILVFPLSGTVTLTFVLAVWFFASGLASVAAGIRMRGAPGRAMAIFGGSLSIVLGILIAVELPSSAGWAIGLLVGINLIFWGVRALVGARLLKMREASL